MAMADCFCDGCLRYLKTLQFMLTEMRQISNLSKGVSMGNSIRFSEEKCRRV